MDVCGGCHRQYPAGVFQLYQHMLCSGFNQFISRGGCNDFFGNAYTLFKNCIIWKFAAVFCFKNRNCNRTIYRSCFQQHVVGDLISKEWPGLTLGIHIDPLCIQQCAIHIENNYFCHTLSLLFSLRQLCSPVNRYSVPRFLQNPGRIQGRKPP